MCMRLIVIILALGCTLTATGYAFADDHPKPDLKPLLAEVKKLVEKHYPKAQVTLNERDQTISFEFNTRKFQVHDPLPNGEWQDAHEEVGPKKGGIYGAIQLRAGDLSTYMAILPQLIDKRYFTSFVRMSPYSKKLDHHLLVELKYASNVPKEFLKEFERLVDGFEKHMPVGGM